MSYFLISYDLRKPGKDYSTLHEYLRSYGSRAKPLESVWLVKSSLSFKEIRDAVAKRMDDNDKLLVIDIANQPMAWKNLSERSSNWIKSRF